MDIGIAGGLWDSVTELLHPFNVKTNNTKHSITYTSGHKIQFEGLEHEKDKLKFQGGQFGFAFFDELTHFTETQFLYILTRMRSMSEVNKTCVAGSCNPDADSWVREWVDWYIDDKGFVIPERSGKIIWFVNTPDGVKFAENKEYLLQYDEDAMKDALSFTFIHASLSDNKKLIDIDERYESKVKATDYVNRARLLDGNWNIRAESGLLFNESWFDIVDDFELKAEDILCRGWDLASTEKSKANKDPDWTVGVLLVYRPSERVYYILDVVRVRKSPHARTELMKATAEKDGKSVAQRFEEEGGSSGKDQKHAIVKEFRSLGLNVSFFKPKDSKSQRVMGKEGLSAIAETRVVKLVRGDWNKELLGELHAFPDGSHDDQVDALNNAYMYLKMIDRNKIKVY